MMTIQQLRAARSLLDWTQGQLAQKSGLSRASVAALEQGKGKAHGKTVQAIQLALEQAGIEFTPEPGVRLRREKYQFRVLEGENAVFELWDDIILALGTTGGEVLMSGISEKQWLEKYKAEMTANIIKQRSFKIYTRILLAEGDNQVIIGPASYRAVSKQVFQQTPYFVYADRFAILNWGPPIRILAVFNAAIADTFRQQFEYNWETGRVLDSKKVVVAKLEGLPVIMDPILLREK